jgi:hypothetical protein
MATHGPMRSTLNLHRSRVARVVGAEILLVVTFVLMPLAGRDWAIGAVAGVMAVFASMALVARRGRRLGASQTPILDVVLLASWMFVLLVVGFAAIYYAMATHGAQLSGLHTKIDALYFTVTTLSTVGFGDIVATSQAARLVVTVQVVFNLTFVAVSVRVLFRAGNRHYEALTRN